MVSNRFSVATRRIVYGSAREHYFIESICVERVMMASSWLQFGVDKVNFILFKNYNLWSILKQFTIRWKSTKTRKHSCQENEVLLITGLMTSIKNLCIMLIQHITSFCVPVHLQFKYIRKYMYFTIFTPHYYYLIFQKQLCQR